MRTTMLALLLFTAVSAQAQGEIDLPEHGGDVMAIAFSDNGRHLASVSKSDLIVWDATTLTMKKSFDLPGAAVGISDDGKLLALTTSTASLLELSADKATGVYPAGGAMGEPSMALQLTRSALVHATSSGKLVRVDPKKRKVVWSVAAHPDNFLGLHVTSNEAFVATCGKDKLVKVWNAKTGAAIRTYEGHAAICEGVRISDDGKTLVSSGLGELILWDTATGKPRDVFLLGASNLALTKDGKRLATAGPEGLMLWDTQSSLRLSAIGGVPFHAVAFSPDGKTLVATAEPKRYVLRFFDVAALIAHSRTPQADLLPFRGHGAGIERVEIAKADQTILSSDKDGLTKVWDLKSGRVVTTIPGSLGGLSPKGDVALVSRKEGHVLVDPATGKELGALPAIEGDVALEPDGDLLVLGKEGLRVLGRDGVEKKKRAFDEPVSSAKRSPDGQRIAVIAGATVKLLDGTTLADVSQLVGHGAPVSAVAFSGDAKLLVSFATTEGRAIAWDVLKGAQVGELSVGAERLRSVAVDPTGKLAAVGTAEGLVTLFEPRGGKKLGTIASLGDKGERDVGRGWSPDVKSLTFTSDGKRLVVSSLNRSIRLWDVKSLQQVQRLAGFYEFGQLRDPTLDRAMLPFSHRAAGAHGDAVTACAEGKDDVALKAIDSVPMELDFRVQGWTLLLVCSRYGSVKSAERLLTLGADPNVQLANGETALTLVIEGKHLSLIKALLEAKADPNQLNAKRQSSLLRVVGVDDDPLALDKTRLLVEAGANVNARGPNDATPLHYASVFASPEIVRYLLSKGANPDARDGDGHNPLTWADNKGRNDNAGILRGVTK